MQIFINFKNYSSGIGEKQRELLDFLESLSFSKTRFSSAHNSKFLILNSINLVTPATEISPIWQNYNFPLWSQHCDPVENARATGWISAEQIKKAGGIGTMLNHSEHRLPFHVLKNTVQICHEHELKTLICCQNVEEGKKFAKELHPDFLAYEPPELIASKIDSVTSKSREIQELTAFLSSHCANDTQHNASPTVFLIGAGIREKEDIKTAENLGAKGILLASSVMEGTKKEIKKLLS